MTGKELVTSGANLTLSAKRSGWKLGGFDLTPVLNPFGLAMLRGLDLNQVLRDTPDTVLLDELVAETKGVAEGAENVLYLLHGANAANTSPMQYGGYYLERDREILSGLGDRLIVIFVVGDEDVYIDFVSDLPGDVFAWDSRTTGVTSAQVREMREGTQASADPNSEILLESDEPSIARLLEMENLGTAV